MKLRQNQIKILLFIDEAKMGGGQQHLLWLVQKIDKSKFIVEVACESKGYLVDELNKINIPVHPINISNRPSFISLKRTYDLLKKISPAVLHTHGGTAGFYGRLAAILNFKGAVIHTYHGIHYLNFDKWFLNRVYTLIDRFLLRFTDCTICVAQNDFNIGLKAKVVRKEKAVVIHNGVDVEKFFVINKNPDYKIKLKKEDDSIIVGSIGRLHYQKGYEYLIEASVSVIKNNPKVKFVLVGEGELRESLESKAMKNGVYNSFIFLGNQTNIPELLAQFDIFVLPSLWEGLPLVLLEAMAAKKPVVATNVNGILEVIQSEKDGLLVESKNPSALSTAIIRLLHDNKLRDRLAANGHSKVLNEFSLKGMIEKTENVYIKYALSKFPLTKK